MDNPLSIMHQYVQFGFAGFAFVLLALLFVLVWRFLNLVRHATDVIASNTTAIRAVCDVTGKIEVELTELRSLFQERPCLLLRSHTMADLHELMADLEKTPHKTEEPKAS